MTREHRFEDKHLFYRITAVSEIKESLDTLSNDESKNKTVHFYALRCRYEHFAKLSIPEILNSFYGCEDQSGWDLSDLDNWRTNMKRWGFGRREAQDDDMVDLLAPLCYNVDPDTWDVSGDEEWESPWGILAQIVSVLNRYILLISLFDVACLC